MGKDYSTATKSELIRWLRAASADAATQRAKKVGWKDYAKKLERENAVLRNMVESNPAH
ncbi:hypothetical protein [Bifidobacterium sp. SO4]|uniref:hypothetical protein n=1 Tax=Bifidobacterium sp. SO4 TaxID=2809030 RepID=UPI001BDCECC5|nr:hypothetical protein [Bifidobacterium sp. SO4]MBT1169600.1 hypothetical protein [Bifidobacterium sp. SO4]